MRVTVLLFTFGMGRHLHVTKETYFFSKNPMDKQKLVEKLIRTNKPLLTWKARSYLIYLIEQDVRKQPVSSEVKNKEVVFDGFE